MFIIGLAVFLPYYLLLCADEVLFHQGRQVSSNEKWNHRVQLLMMLLCNLAVLLLEYSPKTAVFFGIPAIASIIALTRDEFEHSHSCTGKELWLHSILHLIHPFMLITLGAIWPFVNGVSFFTNMVIPFSINYLRPLCYGYTVAIASLLFYQLFMRKEYIAVKASPGLDTVIMLPTVEDKDKADSA